jgi:hypothetical protein
MALRDLTGLRFERLTVLRRVVDVRGSLRVVGLWVCRCDCGGEITTRAGDLRAGRTKSCGCMRREHCRRGPNKQHGESAVGNTTSEYWTWRAMKARCYNPKHVGFKYYGARGIHVCDRWRNSYATFIADMGRRPSAKHSIDRIDVNGHYTPQNCRWATASEQRLNQRPFAH